MIITTTQPDGKKVQLLIQCKKLIPLVFVGVVSLASAQGVTAAHSFVPGMAVPSAPELPGLQRFIGKRYWITPKTNARYRIRFQTIAAGTVADSTFFVTEPASVSIAGFDARTPRHAIVRFSDGRMAMMDEPVLYNSRSDQLFVIERSPNGVPEDSSTEYLHTAPPEAYARAEHRMQVTQAAAKVRAGVTLGMTADQVRASQWGAPSRINRTTVRDGVHEQWVYGDHNFIYLENGVVTAVQN